MLETNPWLPWAIASAAFAALTAIFSKIGVQEIDSTSATFLRTVFVAAILGLFLASRKMLPSLSGLTTRPFVFLLLSALATGASWLCYFRALQLGDAARVAPIDKFSVILVAIIGAFFLGEKLTGLNWLGVVVTAFGLILVALR